MGAWVLALALVWFTERGFQQANGITLTEFGRCNNSSGDDLARRFASAGTKLFARGVECFAHRRNRFRLERARL